MSFLPDESNVAAVVPLMLGVEEGVHGDDVANLQVEPVIVGLLDESRLLITTTPH